MQMPVTSAAVSHGQSQVLKGICQHKDLGYYDRQEKRRNLYFVHDTQIIQYNFPNMEVPRYSSKCESDETYWK